MEHLKPLIREMGLENRIFILRGLQEGSKSIADIRRELKRGGVNKPFSTVARYMRGLEEMRLVCETEDGYHLTLKGRILLSGFNDLEYRLEGFKKMEEVLLEYPIDYLPDEFLNEIHVMELAEVVSDPFNVMWDTIKAVEGAKRKVRIVNKDIINRNFGELAVKRCVEGRRLSSVVDSSTVNERIDMLYDIIKEQGIKGEDLDALKRNFVVRKLNGVSLNLIITDKKGAGISLPNPKSANSLTPAFKSSENDFIKWVEKIFMWHWEKGEDVKW